MSSQVIELARYRPQRQASDDARAGLAWFNSLAPAERRHWHEVAGSAVPADCWRAYQLGEEAHP